MIQTLLQSILLQTSNACGQDDWANGEWYRCMFEPAASSVGEPLAGILTGGTIVLSLYLAGDGGLAAPAVVTILLAAALVPLLPGGMVGFAAGIAFIGLVSVLMSIGRRYVLPQGVP